MTEIESTEEKDKKPSLRALLIKLGVVSAFIIMLVFGAYLSFNSVGRGSEVNGLNNLTGRCYKAITDQVKEYYGKQGIKPPNDKEYIVRATYDRDGLVNERCELLPDSEKNGFFDDTSEKTRYIVIKYRAGGGFDAWLAEKPLTDDMLRPYDTDEQEKMYSVLFGTKNVIGYLNSDTPTEYYP